jgi:hypothetical protein
MVTDDFDNRYQSRCLRNSHAAEVRSQSFADKYLTTNLHDDYHVHAMGAFEL